MKTICGVGMIWAFLSLSSLSHAQPNPAQIDWVTLDAFSIARTETTIAQFRRFAQATKLTTLAEKNGGGEIFESGWTKKAGWTWAAPFGVQHKAADDEPAAHVTFHEAKAFCAWAGGALPSDAQWARAAYTEMRAAPSPPFVRGKTYSLPSGDSPEGQQCLGDCNDGEARARAVKHSANLLRGFGHARVGMTRAGVNGLFDMGGNLWEWVDEPAGASGNAERRTRGGSWWYGAAQMRSDHMQSKPADTAVGYIGFRCVR